MKKLILVIAISLAALSANAQLKLEVAGNYGGYTNNKQAFIVTDKYYSSGIGFNGGVLFDIPITEDKNFYFEPGVYYLMSNISYKGTNNRYKTHWVQVPLSLGVDLPLGPIAIICGGGLYYGRAVSGANLGNVMLKKNDFGFLLKAGLGLTKHVGLFVAYNRGLIDISDTPGTIARSTALRFGLWVKM